MKVHEDVFVCLCVISIKAESYVQSINVLKVPNYFGRPCPALPQLEHAVHNFCEIPRAPDNGRFEFPPNTRKFQAGSRIVLWCVDGFVPIGGNTQTCLSDGTWDGISPKCIDRRNGVRSENKSLRRKRGENTDRAKLAKLPYGNNKFNGEESTLEDLTNSHVGTDRGNNANTCIMPRIPQYGRMDYPDNIAHFSPGTKVTYSCNDGYALRGQSSRECLPTGQWNGPPPDCQEKKETGFGLPAIIIIVVLSIVVLSIGVLYMKKIYACIKRQNTTTYHLNGIEIKQIENGLIDKSESEPALSRLLESEPVNIREDGKDVLSLRQKVETPQVKMLPPRSASGSSTSTRERPVTSTDDEHASTKSPAKDFIIYGSKDIVKNQGEASVSSDDETDSSSSRHVTVNAVIETSMDADKRPESRLMDDIASDDGSTGDDYGSTDKGNNLIAQETGLA